MRCYILGLLFVLLVLLESSRLYANYGLDYLNSVKCAAQAWNTGSYENDGCTDGFRIRISVNVPDYWVGGDVIVNSLVQQSCVFNWYGGPYQWGDLLSYTDTGQLFTGYDACYGFRRTIQSRNIIVVDPTYIQNVSNDRYCLPYPYIFLEYPGNNVGGSWAGYCLNMDNGRIYWVGFGDSFNQRYELPCGLGGPCPTPSPVPSPVPSPLPSPVSSPVSSPPPVPMPSPMSNGTTTVTINTSGSSTVNVNVSTSVQCDANGSELEKYFISGSNEDAKIAEVANGQYDSSVPDVGQPQEIEYSWLDSLLSLMSNHPIIAVIKGSSLTAVSEVCELSCVVFGKTITFSFCEWAWFFDYLGYFVLAFAMYYAIVIVFIKGA